MNKTVHYRHGDVLLKKVTSEKDLSDIKQAGKKAEKHSQLTIALGEATGHHHTLYPMLSGALATGSSGKKAKKAKVPTVQMIEINGRKFLDVGAEYFLRHQEHAELKIDPGCYEIVMEDEYDPFERQMRKVVD